MSQVTLQVLGTSGPLLTEFLPICGVQLLLSHTLFIVFCDIDVTWLPLDSK